MYKTCVQLVNELWTGGRQTVDGHPQNMVGNNMNIAKTVQNHIFLPHPSDRFPHTFPHACGNIITLLISSFSPLSTQPITITTNLKNKER